MRFLFTFAENYDVDLEALALRVKRSENLPVLPQVASTVLRMAEDPRTSAKDMERAIERDLSLATKILKVANSSYYGMQNVSSIARAVSVLGINTVRSLVVSLAYQQMISGRSTSVKFKRTDFWAHSLGVGICSRIVAKMLVPQRAEELYLAGLMHDVGLLVLDRFMPGEFDEAITLAKNERLQLHMAEREILGFDHAQVGGLLAQQWGLSKTISNAVAHHHDVMSDVETPQTTSVVAVANALAHSAGLVNHTEPGQTQMDVFAMETLQITEEQLNVIGVVMVQEVSKAQTTFQITAAAA